eukprot:GILJ01000622.1.p1 GENE.GILJ01000622.1~~GILJ01000622.1.p1  ORF type:complete len:244 (+),score=42.31 GILJ01000622.1:75-806(+)
MLSVAATKHHSAAADGPSTRTTNPMVTGGSVVGIKYQDGVLIAADTLASYGTMARFKDIQRLQKVGQNTIIGVGGELSDFQYMKDILRDLEVSDWAHDDDAPLTPHDICNWLGRVLYNRRSKMDPLWNQVVLGGFENGKSYLGVVDLLGTQYEDDHIATGFGTYLAKPLLRSRHRNDMTEQEAVQLLEDCMRVIYYRDCKATNKIQISKVTARGVEVSPAYALQTQWEYQRFIDPGAAESGSW